MNIDFEAVFVSLAVIAGGVAFVALVLFLTRGRLW